MPKNQGKGGKSFKASKSKGIMQEKRELIEADPEEGESYGLIKQALGQLNMRVQLPGGLEVIGVVRGAMVHKQRVSVGDVVIVSRREFNQNDKYDIIHRYQQAEVRKLISAGIIPREFKPADDKSGAGGNNDYVEFVATEVEDRPERVVAHGVDVKLDFLPPDEDEDDDLPAAPAKKNDDDDNKW